MLHIYFIRMYTYQLRKPKKYATNRHTCFERRFSLRCTQYIYVLLHFSAYTSSYIYMHKLQNKICAFNKLYAYYTTKSHLIFFEHFSNITISVGGVYCIPQGIIKYEKCDAFINPNVTGICEMYVCNTRNAYHVWVRIR